MEKKEVMRRKHVEVEEAVTRPKWEDHLLRQMRE